MIEPRISNISEKSGTLRRIAESAQSVIELNNFQVFGFSNLDLTSAFETKTILENNIHNFLKEDLQIKARQTDLLLADLPWNIPLTSIGLAESESSSKRNAEYQVIKKLLGLLSDKGLGLFILPPSIFISQKAKEFLTELESLGYSATLAFNLPTDFLEGATSIRPMLVGFQKSSDNKLFVAEVDYDTQTDELFKSFKDQTDTHNLFTGTFVNRSEFTSFTNYQTQQQIERLNSGYKQFKTYLLSDLATDVFSTKETFTFKINSILIPKVGTSSPVVSFDEARLKHQNYYYVLLDEEIVSAKYLVIYFNSEIGKLSLQAHKTYSFIPHTNKSDLLSLVIPIPNKETQTLIIATQLQLNQLKEEIHSLETELSLNPQNSKRLQVITTDTLESLGKLSDEERVLKAIRSGETKETEFKQTFNIDTRTGKKEKYIQESALKNIVAFLNTKGGVLLIGVKDDGRQITGIEVDDYQNDDNYSLNFKNAIKSRISEKFYPFIEWNIVDIENKKVLEVECSASDTPCYLDDKDFYVRTNPSADKLDGPRLVEYIQSHFGNK